LLPGLTVEQAAAGRSTLLAVIIAVAAGAVVLVPSLVLLFRLFLRGRLDPTVTPESVLTPPAVVRNPNPRLLASFAGATLVIGTGITVFADPGWARTVGIVCLCACAITTFGVVAATEPDHET
jgi:cytochrome d ubiquinol oxidase subunit II